MIPLEFIASLPHGEAKAAALTVYNLMTPKWIEITDDPATLPEKGRTVAIREKDPATWPEKVRTVAIREKNDSQLESVGWFDGLFPDTGNQRWYRSKLAYWEQHTQAIEPAKPEVCLPQPTHWRPIS